MPQQLAPAARASRRTACAALVLAQPDAHRQRVDEQAQRPVRALRRPACRPNSTVPNTTSSRPMRRASTCAQARWNRLAALTPSAPRLRPQPPRQLRLDRQPRLRRCPLPSPCTSSSPNGAVGSSTSPSSCAEERLVLLRAHAQARLRHEVAERQRRRQLARRAQQMRLRSPARISSSVVWSHRQVVAAAAAAASGRSAASCGDARAQQRRLAHVEPVVARIEARLQLRAPRRPPPRPARPPPPAAAPAATPPAPARGRPFPQHRRAQDVVPVDHRLQRLRGSASSRARLSKRQQRRQQIRIALALPAGGGTECLPAAAPADRCPACWPRRPARRRRSASISAWLELAPAAASPA